MLTPENESYPFCTITPDMKFKVLGVMVQKILQMVYSKTLVVSNPDTSNSMT